MNWPMRSSCTVRILLGEFLRTRMRRRRAVAVAVRSSTYICLGELHPSVRVAVQWIRLHDRKSVSGCRLAPRVSAALVRRRMASGEAVCREKKGGKERKRKKTMYILEPSREIPGARRSIASATEIYRLNNAVDNYAQRT